MATPLRNNTGQALNLQGARAVAVTPNDSTDLSLVDGNTGPTLYIGSDGNVAVETIGGDTVTFANVVAGSFMPLQVRKVLATGTTSTGILEIR
jgi:hypothetical protein